MNSRQTVNRLIKDESGAVFTVLILILIPLLIFIIVGKTEIKRLYIASDNNLQNAVSFATKNATDMVDVESQSQGNPRIAYEKAINEFKNSIVYELGLNNSDNSTLIMKNMKYWVVIYNGDTTYSGYDENNKVASYAYYTNESGTEVNDIDNTITGFPKTLYITDSGISDTQTSDSVKVTLTAPGVLAVVQGEVNGVYTKNTTTTTRWAYAKIVKKQGGT